MKAGDRCLLHGGTYFVTTRCVLTSPLHGTPDNPIVITAAGDGPVIIDGTIEIPGPWTPAQPIGWMASTPSQADVLQVFTGADSRDAVMKVLAREPNANWTNKSIFMGVKNWFRSSVPGVHNTSTGEGLLRDTGACQSSDECCARCNHNDLATSGINATGALAIVNLWSCDTGVQRITKHSKSEPSVMHYNATWDGLCDFYRGGDGRYYLEGLNTFLDSPEEWLFDNDTKQVVLFEKPKEGTTVRGRVADFALVVTNASWLQISDISFHATTISVAGDVHDCSFMSLEFNYSSISRRSLGIIDPPAVLSLWRDQRLETESGINGRFLFKDIVVRYSDGPALQLHGHNSTLSDSFFEWNDWSTVGGSWPLAVEVNGKAARATTLRTGGNNSVYERLSFQNNGAAQSFSAGGPTIVKMCYFQSQLAIQDDGSFVEGGGTPSNQYYRNWCTNSGKAGLRWDGYYPGTLGGLMMENIVWNTSAIVIKGDQHNVTRNTAFDAADTTASHAAHDRPRFQDERSSLGNFTRATAVVGMGTKHYDPRANNLSTFTFNLFDAVSYTGAACPDGPPCKLPGSYFGNIIGAQQPFDIRAELRDPYHLDFRPCINSSIAIKAVGAYSPSLNTYWIPGRRLRTGASTPIPPTDSIGVHRNANLMFLPSAIAFENNFSQVRHEVYMGERENALVLIANLSGESNIVSFHDFKANTNYVWRVDSIVERQKLTGMSWTFRTGSQYACQIVPHPPPMPPPPPPDCATCTACEHELCPGLKGGGQKCEDCIFAHAHVFNKVGCWIDAGRHAFIETFCYSH